MSTFIDCIRSAVTSGRITEAKAAEAEAAFNEAYEDGLAEGLAESAARDAAANRAVEKTMKLKGEKRWRRINEMRRAHELYTRVQEATNLPNLLEKISDEVEVAYNRNRGLAQRFIAENTEKFRPKLAGLRHPVRDMDDIAYAAWGENVRDPTAKLLAQEIFEVYDYMRRLANMWGAAIPVNPNRRLPQTHDRLKVGAVPKDQWVDEHLSRLDWDLMRYDDKPIPAASRVEILGRVYDAIRTDGNSRITPGHTSAEHLASRLSKERFLYYKDAKSYLEMQKKYGSGNIFQQTIAMIDSMSRDIATLEKLGPNPNGMKNFLANAVNKKAADAELVKPTRRGKTQVKKAAEALELFDRQYNLHNLLVLNGEENVMAQTMATARTAVLGSLLSSAYIPNLFGDLFMANFVRFANRLPATTYITSYLRHFIPNRENRLRAVRSGLIADSATSMAQSYQRYFGPMDGAMWSQRYSDVVLRASFLTPHTQAMRWGFGMEMMGQLADLRTTSYDNLPFVKMFRDNGITEADWNLLRSTPVHEEGGATWLRPVDLADRAEGNSAQNQLVANKFLDMLQVLTREAAPVSTGRVRAMLGQDLSATSLSGQVMRTGSALMSFPFTILMVHGKKLMNMDPKDGVRNAAAFFAFLTLAGAFITQTREIIGGRDPMDMTTPDFWLRSIVNGGSLGIYGDVIFGAIEASQGGVASEFATGPMVEFYDRTSGLTGAGVKALFGQEDSDLSVEAIRWLRLYGPRIWQMRLLLDRTIYDTLMQHADPEAYRRLRQMERKRLTERNQGMWWGVGQEPRAPDVGAVVGGSRR